MLRASYGLSVLVLYYILLTFFNVYYTYIVITRTIYLHIKIFQQGGCVSNDGQKLRL
jgi:hypothetical protein